MLFLSKMYAAHTSHQTPFAVKHNIGIASVTEYRPPLYAWEHTRYLAGVVVVEPALQVDGVPARQQTAILEDP